MLGARFQCNICGAASVFEPEGDWRETPSCQGCGSSVRMRSLVHALTQELFGRSSSLDTLPRTGITGGGLSDWAGYADRLTALFDYTNTFYHRGPKLDICAPDPEWLGAFDFLISSDVFEHVFAPVSDAFAGALAVLKPGGLFVMTAPYDEQLHTREHYPMDADLKVIEFSGEFVVVHRTRDGQYGLDASPVFHGGPGSTLEMRMFSLPDLIQLMTDAGFEDVRVHQDPCARFGVFPPHPWGLPITGRRPIRTR